MLRLLYHPIVFLLQGMINFVTISQAVDLPISLQDIPFIQKNPPLKRIKKSAGRKIRFSRQQMANLRKETRMKIEV